MTSKSLGQGVLVSTTALVLFATLGALLVAFTHQATYERIVSNERQALLSYLNQLVPPGAYDNDLLADSVEIDFQDDTREPVRVYRARQAGSPVAALFGPVVANGYAGPIKLLVAIDAEGVLNGVRVLQHRETPGLGDRIDAQRSTWIHGFEGRSLENPAPSRWRVQRDGGEFDQITGATITPRAVVGTVLQTLRYFAAHREQLFATAG